MNFHPSNCKHNYKITLFVDSKNSWILPWAKKLKTILDHYHTVSLCFDKKRISKGNFNFLLGCTSILENKYLVLNELNLVIHESNLPEGKGWSPLSWQIIEGKNKIPIVMFEALEELDAGKIYLADILEFNGNELFSEIKAKQGQKTLEMVLRFLEQWPDIFPIEQTGTPSFYEKRTIAHDMIDINKSIAENFDHLRIADNEKYPAWFNYRGRRYILKIFSCDCK